MAQKKYVSLSKLSTFLDNLKNIFASVSHKHTMSDITDYTVDSALSSTSTNPVQNKVLDAEFDAISDALGALDLAIDNKADTNHNHNDLYYTESEIDSKLDTKANATHNHDDRYYTETEINTKLANKADLSHTHTKADVGLSNVENKSSATIRGELTKANVTDALGYTPPTTDTTYSAITNDEIDEICSGTMATYLNSIASEGVSF